MSAIKKEQVTIRSNAICKIIHQMDSFNTERSLSGSFVKINFTELSGYRIEPENATPKYRNQCAIAIGVTNGNVIFIVYLFRFPGKIGGKPVVDIVVQSNTFVG